MPADFNATNIAKFNITTFIDEVGGFTLVGGTFFYAQNAGNNASTTTGSNASATIPGTPSATAASAGLALVAQMWIACLTTGLSSLMLI